MKHALFASRLRVLRLLLFNVVLLFSAGYAAGQALQREWVRTYFNVQSKLNQPAGILLNQTGSPLLAGTAIAIAPDGNIVVAGTSENLEGDLDYEIIEYKPNGDEAWKVRYGSPNQGLDQLRDMTVDPNGNIIATGTSVTLKIDSNGSPVWAAPIGGRALVATTNYVYITGFSDTDITAAQLENNNVDGRELWRRSVDGHNHGQDIGEAITLDAQGNVYVAGQEEYEPCLQLSCWRLFAVVSFSPSGVQRWLSHATAKRFPASGVDANSIVVKGNDLVYVYGTYAGLNATLAAFSSTGSVGVWDYRSPGGGALGAKMIEDRATGGLLCTGSDSSYNAAFVNHFSSDDPSIESNLWKYAGVGQGTVGLDLAQDSLANIYVTGYTYNNDASGTMFVGKVTSSGQQLGLDRFNSPNARSNFGTGVAVDAHDNVYVTGYVLNTQGGSEIVTIKYSAAPQIEKKPSGAMHLEFHTTPGQQYSIEATTNFVDWQSIITNIADINGLIQFDDANAPTIPYRFYRGNSAP